ncbi:MAG: HAD family hydrolase [Nitrospiraceae bacterium]
MRVRAHDFTCRWKGRETGAADHRAKSRAVGRAVCKGHTAALSRAVDFVKRAGARYRLAIASSGTREQIRFALAGTPIEKDFQVTVAAEDISVGKPDPEIYRLTLALLNQTAPLLESEVRSEYCVIIEDSLAGIQAGLAAGMKVAAISTTYPAAHLGHAHLVIPCLNVATLENLESLFPSSQSDRSGP